MKFQSIPLTKISKDRKNAINFVKKNNFISIKRQKVKPKETKVHYQAKILKRQSMKIREKLQNFNCFTVFKGRQAFVRDLELEGVDEWSWITQNGDVF